VRFPIIRRKKEGGRILTQRKRGGSIPRRVSELVRKVQLALFREKRGASVHAEKNGGVSPSMEKKGRKKTASWDRDPLPPSVGKKNLPSGKSRVC